VSARRTRVLAVSPSLGEGGAQRVTSVFLTHLDRSRFEPSLFLFRDKITFPLPDDVRVGAFRPGHEPPIGESARRRPWRVLQTIAMVRRHIAATRPDVVVSNIDQVNCVTGTALHGLRAGVRPRWIAMVGIDPSRESRAQTIWARWAYRRADLIVVNSAHLLRVFTDRYPSARGRTRYIANATDFAQNDRLAARPPSRRRGPSVPLLVAVGRLVRDKRPDLLVAAAARLRETTPVEVWWCGDGPLRAEVEADIAARGLADSFHLLGFCDNPYALIAQADLFVMTSDREGLPNALIEAQGLGVPAVSTDCLTGPSEIVEHGVTGLLVPPGDTGAVAGAVRELLGDWSRRRAMGQAARRRALARYGAPEVLAEWERVLVDNSA